MTSRVLSLKNKIGSKFNSVSILVPKFPERLKGTIIEKWAKYWKFLINDYKEVAIEVGKEIKAKPLKAAIYGSTGGAIYICVKKNPTEESFIDKLRQCNSDILLVHESCHKPESAQHLRFLERCLNEGVLRRLSLGVVSFMWLDNYSESVAIYKAVCPYLEPKYSTFHERIIDVGFWNKWWKLDEKMIDYDVNV